MKDNFYAVILSGGSGERFWPLSTPDHPKQFLSVFGGKSLLRQSVERLKGLLPVENILVVTGKSLAKATYKELPELPRRNIILEPCRRDTAAAVATACTEVEKRGGENAVAVYYERLRTLVRALKADPRFDVTDCEKLAASFAPRKSIGRKEIPAIRASLAQRLGPIGSSWCVADAFQAAVELLRGRESHKPGYVYGFLEPPKGVARPTRVAAADLRKAAEGIDLGTFIPPSIAVGGREIGPADFLYAALEALETGANEVVAIPRDQLGPIASLMPSLSTYSMKGGWPLYEDTFEDKYLTPRLRLQLWTLRYEK